MRLNWLKLRRWHHWLALIFGGQLVLWSLSGAVMVWLELSYVHGGHLLRSPPPLPTESSQLLAQAASDLPAAEQLTMAAELGPELVLIHTAQDVQLYNINQQQTVAVDAAFIAQQARRLHHVGAAPSKIELLPTPPAEVSGWQQPVWQANYGGIEQPSLYFDPATGLLITQRHNAWRAFDFMWMLHIMDYEARADTGKCWLQLWSIGNLLLLGIGVMLLIPTIRRWRGGA